MDLKELPTKLDWMGSVSRWLLRKPVVYFVAILYHQYRTINGMVVMGSVHQLVTVSALLQPLADPGLALFILVVVRTGQLARYFKES